MEPIVLSIGLFDPGMGLLHRAGLGGLAATLESLNDRPSSKKHLESIGTRWEYDDAAVRFTWTDPLKLKDSLKSLYEYGLGLNPEGLISLPGTHDENGMSRYQNVPEVLAELQRGLSLTLLQFGPNRKSKGNQTKSYEQDNKRVQFQHQELIGFTHRSAWESLLNSKGGLASTVEVPGTIAPGFAQRHVAHPSTKIEQPPGHAMALHFALVGTLSLAIDTKTGVLVIPDVQNLTSFVSVRDRLLPRRIKDCQVTGYEDAALLMAIRFRYAEKGHALGMPRCMAIQFATKAWNDKQKSRAAVLDIDLERLSSGDEDRLDLFDKAAARFPARIATAKPTKKNEEPQSFWAKSVARPLIAENIARGRPWYENFRRLVVAEAGKTDEQRVRALSYEAKGLQAMLENLEEDAKTLVDSIHQAMRGRFAEIADQNKNNATAMGNRMDRQRQRWRLAFANAKTADEVREALADMWSRGGNNESLRQGWQTLLPMFLEEERWRLLRDLALLALSSYKSKPREQDDAADEDPGDDL